jgi:ribosomal protein S18 acetylase RimI-like enzyme
VTVTLRDYAPADEAAVNAVALAGFAEYRASYPDWPAFVKTIGKVASLAQTGELIVATRDGQVAGVVGYFGPSAPKAHFFEPGWAVIRMLAVDPAARGLGLGRALTLECIARAERDGAASIALHTSSIMAVALAMYRRLGFRFLKDAPPLFGVPYGVYVKDLR